MKKLILSHLNTNSGEIVEIAVRRHGVSISELARRMQVNRRTVYNWFKQRRLKIEIIFNIGYIIGYDFSTDFPVAFQQYESAAGLAPPDVSAGDGAQVSSQVFYWMNKYIALLEKYNNLLLCGDAFYSKGSPDILTAG